MQLIAQLLPVHVAVPLGGAAQAWPHDPQLPLSLLKLTHPWLQGFG